MLRPRTLGKVAFTVLVIGAVVVAIIFAAQTDTDEFYKGARAITAAILALTFATLYRYVED